MVTASHNPKAYTGVKLVREGALALSGDAGIGEIQRADRGGPRATPPGGGERRGGRRLRRLPAPRAVVHRRRGREAAEGRRRRRQRHGGPDGRPAARAPRARPRRDLLDARRRVPRPRAEPAAAREPPASSSTGSSTRAPTSGSPGTATPTAASSSTTRASSSTATSSPRCSRAQVLAKQPGAAIVYDVRASRAVPDTVAEPAGTAYRQPGRPRLLQDRDARARRRVRRRGLRPLLLPRLLVRRLGHDPGAARPRAALELGPLALRAGRRRFASATSSPARSTPRSPTRTAKMQEIAERSLRRRDHLARRRLGRLPRLALQRPPVEHRAAAAAQPRVARLARGHGGQARRGAGPDPRVTPEEALERAARGRDPPAADPDPVRRRAGQLLPDRGRAADPRRHRPELGQVARRARAPARRPRPLDRGPRAGDPHPPAHRPPRPGRDRRLALGGRGRGDRRRSCPSSSDYDADAERDDEFAAGLMLRHGIPEELVVRAAERLARASAAGARARRSPGRCATASARARATARSRSSTGPGHSPSDTVFWDADRADPDRADHLIAAHLARTR